MAFDCAAQGGSKGSQTPTVIDKVFSQRMRELELTPGLR
jgi:hypothetical protein